MDIKKYNKLVRDRIPEIIEAGGSTCVTHVERDESRMAEKITDIIDLCEATDCQPLRWFAKLPFNHFEGIIAHATYPISSGKVEGINQRIKTLRRQGYGYPDDGYFFLKLFDMS